MKDYQYADAPQKAEKPGKKGKPSKSKHDKPDRLTSELGLHPAEIRALYPSSGKKGGRK